MFLLLCTHVKPNSFRWGVVMYELKSSQKRIVGLKQTLKAIANNSLLRVYLAKDADNYIIQSVLSACSGKNLEIVYIDTMKELGEACGIEIGASTAGITID